MEESYFDFTLIAKQSTSYQEFNVSDSMAESFYTVLVLQRLYQTIKYTRDGSFGPLHIPSEMGGLQKPVSLCDTEILEICSLL